jgi:hypothetical protein
VLRTTHNPSNERPCSILHSPRTVHVPYLPHVAASLPSWCSAVRACACKRPACLPSWLQAQQLASSPEASWRLVAGNTAHGIYKDYPQEDVLLAVGQVRRGGQHAAGQHVATPLCLQDET